jgi:hypothetical protein
MCRTKERKNLVVSIDPTNNPSQERKPVPLPPIQSLQRFLTNAYLAEQINLEPSTMVINGFTLKNKEAAISIILIDTDGNNHYAEINGTKMHYSGSLVKVAALYAAFDLRATARKHAKDNNSLDQNAFFTSLTSAIDTRIVIQRLKDFGKGLKPDLTKIFKGFKDTGLNKVEFLDSFQTDLDNIGENVNAGRIIRALGYSYINLSMMRGNFFSEATLKGVWLAGDYSQESILKSVRVPVENDIVPGGSGQAITTKEMSRMFQLIHTKQGLSHVTDVSEKAAGNKGMHDILITEGSFFFGANTTVNISVPPKFSNDCAKVGIGTLGPIGTPGPSVISEGDVMKWSNNAEVTNFNTKYKRKLTGDFALCWQNMYQPNAHFDALVRILNTSIQNFLTQ